MSTLQEVIDKENSLFRRLGGCRNLPESCMELNDLQRQKIEAVFTEHGSAFLGMINRHQPSDNRYTEYVGQRIYNFDADFVIPNEDVSLMDMLDEWNNGQQPKNLLLIDQIFCRIEACGGAKLIWT